MLKNKRQKTVNSSDIWHNLLLILRPERSFYITAVIYGIGVSALSLGIPISVQALVNTVTFGVLIQQLIILGVVLFALLIFSSSLYALQTYVLEIFQRHIYARTSSDMVIRLLEGEYKSLEQKNGTKLVNRYFDVMTIQKNTTLLLTGGMDIVLQTFVGLLLLAFYHPYFLIFDIILVLVFWLAWGLFWKNAIRTAVEESTAKYETASWLEEVARANLFFKTDKRKEYALEKSDQYIINYLDQRKYHFKYSFAQKISLLLIYAFMSALVLCLGGFLVIKGQLTLGQLVAAELVLTIILGGVVRSEKYFTFFYDLYSAVYKISAFYEIQPEDSDGKIYLEPHDLDRFDLNFEEVEVMATHYGHKFNINYNFLAGKTYFIHRQFYSSKLVLIELIQKLIHPDKGSISFGDHKISDINASNLRDYIYVINQPIVIEGSIEENLIVGSSDITPAEINNALDIVELSHLYTTFEEGLETKLNFSGYPLWSSQVIRLEIARVILLKPKIVVLTESFDQIETKRRKKIMDYFVKANITVLLFSHRDIDDFKIDKYLSISGEKLLEFDSKEEFKASRDKRL